jgi:hypothetical protein
MVAVVVSSVGTPGNLDERRGLSTGGRGSGAARGRRPGGANSTTSAVKSKLPRFGEEPTP